MLTGAATPYLHNGLVHADNTAGFDVSKNSLFLIFSNLFG
jgi:hypothetical protein